MCIARKNRHEGVVWDPKVLYGIDTLLSFHAEDNLKFKREARYVNIAKQTYMN